MFEERKATEKLMRRRLIYSKGVNDATYVVRYREGDIQESCPYYRVWVRMLERCYSEAWLKKKPAYLGCKVCPNWLTFSSFRAWMQSQSWAGNVLDKDLRVPGNKTYGPAFCMFIPKEVNSLLIRQLRHKGKYPEGVNWHSRDNIFRAQMSKGGKKVFLGNFSCPEKAAEVYAHHKFNYIKEVAETCKDLLVKECLIRYADIYQGKL